MTRSVRKGADHQKQPVRNSEAGRAGSFFSERGTRTSGRPLTSRRMYGRISVAWPSRIGWFAPLWARPPGTISIQTFPLIPSFGSLARPPGVPGYALARLRSPWSALRAFRRRTLVVGWASIGLFPSNRGSGREPTSGGSCTQQIRVACASLNDCDPCGGPDLVGHSSLGLRAGWRGGASLEGASLWQRHGMRMLQISARRLFGDRPITSGRRARGRWLP